MTDQDNTQKEAIRTLAKMTSMHTNFPGGSHAVDQFSAKRQAEKIRQALGAVNIAQPAQPRQKSALSILWLLIRLVLMFASVYLLINFVSQL